MTIFNGGYDNNPQQISNIADTSYREAGLVRTPEIKQQQFSYDANGNLLSINSGEKRDGKLQAANSRKLLWDEENRLLALSDNGFVSNYWYDAAGERTVKMSGENEEVLVNGRLLAGRLTTNNFTAYISPYLVVRNGGEYTKHIYIGSQRITSKVANSGIFSATPVTTSDQQAKYAELTAKIRARFDSLGVTYSGRPQTGGLVSNSPTEASASYFYHSDHLGSSSLITDINGNLAQHLEYIPYGEVFIDERNSTWNTPYRFNGKEQDEETGLCYYGARYYDPRTSVWLSVDPLAEKYAGRSSYEFTGSNPVKFVDPDGKELTIPLLVWKATGYLLEKYGSNANVKTAGYAMSHPINAVRTGTVDIPTWGISKIASNFEVNLRNEAGFTKGEGSQGNAYRHTLWQSMLTNELGADQATRIGNAHENNLLTNMNQRNFGKNMDAADQMVDLLNNAIGREIGEKNKGASNQELSVAVLKEYKQNGLWTVSGNEKIGYKVEKTQLSQKEYNKALKVLQTKGKNGLNQ